MNKTNDSTSVKIGIEKLQAEIFADVVIHKRKVEIHPEAAKKNEDSFNFLLNKSKQEVIYGVNTGLGPMAQYRVSDNEVKNLQLNLIRSHSAGTGDILNEIETRGVMLARLTSLCGGYSAMHPSVLITLVNFLNLNILPAIYKHGGVGASGDLVQLAHLALCLIGEGEVTYNGKLRPTAEVLNELNINPIEIHCREGLGLINGTSCMTAIGIINIFYAEKLYRQAVMASTLINELCAAFDDHISEEINYVKHHHGQRVVAAEMRKLLKGSTRICKRIENDLLTGTDGEKFDKKVQEYYSIRCIPQILGPIYDTICYSKEILENELNSVSDNPITSVEHGQIFHGGNFHGDYVSLEMDKLKIAITKLSMLAERQLNFLLHHRLNKILPPFINAGRLGLNLGMQGIQYAATSTCAENQMLSNPMYVHSIPSNNDNQDIVSMGTNAALITSKVITNTFEILSIHFICIAQAIYFLKIEDELSPALSGIFKEMKSDIPQIIEDIPLNHLIEKVKNSISRLN